jgi:small basic protein
VILNGKAENKIFVGGFLRDIYLSIQIIFLEKSFIIYIDAEY